MYWVSVFTINLAKQFLDCQLRDTFLIIKTVDYETWLKSNDFTKRFKKCNLPQQDPPTFVTHLKKSFVS